MTNYVDQSSVFGFGDVLTSLQQQNLRDNANAIAEGSNGAPRIHTNAQKINVGDGRDGAFTYTGANTIDGGIYYATSFIVSSGATVHVREKWRGAVNGRTPALHAIHCTSEFRVDSNATLSFQASVSFNVNSNSRLGGSGGGGGGGGGDAVSGSGGSGVDGRDVPSLVDNGGAGGSGGGVATNGTAGSVGTMVDSIHAGLTLKYISCGGGAGGAGGIGNGNPGSAAVGGDGGPSLNVIAQNITFAGVISMPGANGGTGNYNTNDGGNGGGGGGGGGGAIFEYVGSMTDTGSFSAPGGTGGTGGSADPGYGAGGNGGNGGDGAYLTIQSSDSYIPMTR